MASNSTKNTYGNEDGNVRDLSPVSTGYNPLFGESRGSLGSPLALCYRPLRGLNTKSKRPNSRRAYSADVQRDAHHGLRNYGKAFVAHPWLTCGRAVGARLKSQLIERQCFVKYLSL